MSFYIMGDLFQTAVKKLQHLNRRVMQLRSYQGTPDELPGDDQRLAIARQIANAHLVGTITFQLDQARDRSSHIQAVKNYLTELVARHKEKQI